MQIEIRPMEIADISEIVKGWNQSLPYDILDERVFKSVIIDDENHEKGSSLVAVYDGKIVGFISSIARDGVLGADNRGRPYEKDYGFIKGFFVLEDFRRHGIGSNLLDASANYIKSKDKRIFRVITYTGRYFFPGVDLRYEPAIKFFKNKGFKSDHIIDDVDIDLQNFQITEGHEKSRRKMESSGVQIADYEPSMLDEMKKFVKNLDMPAWFPEGWEKGFKNKGNKVVALKDEEIVGWASFYPNGELGSFGPTGVLVKMRHNGIGSCILLESVLQMKKAGCTKVLASWANTPFYLANGWKICRQYEVFQKDLSKQGD